MQMAEERNHDHQNGHAETIMLKNEAGEEKAFELGFLRYLDCLYL